MTTTKENNPMQHDNNYHFTAKELEERLKDHRPDPKVTLTREDGSTVTLLHLVVNSIAASKDMPVPNRVYTYWCGQRSVPNWERTSDLTGYVTCSKCVAQFIKHYVSRLDDALGNFIDSVNTTVEQINHFTDAFEDNLDRIAGEEPVDRTQEG